MAISTLRTKRSRPVRLIEVLANSARNCASSRRASSASLGARKALARGELGFAALHREFVPRTNRQAIVAAVDAVAHQRPQFARDRAFVLDGQIRNAAPRIEPVRLGERRSRADIETGAAGAAIVGLGCVGRQIERGEDRAEKQPRAELARDQIGVLALPAETGAGRQRLFHHRRGIDEHFHVAAGVFDQPARDFFQPRLDQLVIVVALGISRDRGAVRCAQGSPAGPRRGRSSSPA